MSTELVKYDTAVTGDLQRTFKFLVESRKMVKEQFRKNPKAALQTLNQVSAIEAMSQRIKLHDLQHEAMISKLSIQRDIGVLIYPIIKKGRSAPDKDVVRLRDLGISYDESKVWKRYAEVPDYAWKHSIESNIPGKHYLLNEVKRFNEIKKFLSTLEDVRVDPIALKEYFTKNYTLADVQMDLERNGIKIDDEVRQVKAFTRKAQVHEDAAEVEEEVIDEETYENIINDLTSNTVTLSHLVDQWISFFNDVQDVSNRDRENIEISVRKIRKFSIDLYAAYRSLSSRLRWSK